MEIDKEIICDSKIISNYNFSSKKTKEKSKEIKYMGKSLKIILNISLITIIIFIITNNSLSHIAKRKEINDKYFNLEKINNNQQKQLNQIKHIILRMYNNLSIKIQNQQISLNQVKQMISRMYNKISINNKYQQFSLTINQTKQMILGIYNNLSINNKYQIFNQEINQKYIKEQNFFCDNLNFLNNNEFENQITKANIDFNNKSYYIFRFRYSK